jgi:hypothetical protein
MIEATGHNGLEEEQVRRTALESDSLAPARGLLFASLLSAVIYCAAWLLLRE